MVGIASLLAMTQASNISDKKIYFNTDNQKDNSDLNLSKSYYNRQTLANIDRLGKTILDKVIVKKATKVQGYLQIKDSHLNTLEVQGRTVISNSTIRGDAVIQGYTLIDHSRISTLTVQGKLIVGHSTVKGLLDVQGKFDATKTIFENEVSAIGLFEVTKVIFKKEVYNIGKVIAKKTSFNASLTSMSDSIDLYDVTAQDIYVNKKEEACCEKCRQSATSCTEGSVKKKQLITLSGKTIVNGSITFESGEGIVRIGKKAKINGNVIGGIIQKSESLQK